MQEAVARFDLIDGGSVNTSKDLCDQVLQLHQKLFAPALLTLGNKPLSTANDMSCG